MPRLRLPLVFASVLGALLVGFCGAAEAGGATAEKSAASDSPLTSPCDLGSGPRFRCGRITVPAVRGEPSLGTSLGRQLRAHLAKAEQAYSGSS